MVRSAAAVVVLAVLGVVGAGGLGVANGPGAGASSPVVEAAGMPVFTSPLDGPPVVVRPFDGPPQPWAPGHRGVDLAARPGQAVRSPGPGVVTFAGTVVDRGVVTVTHADGLRSSLEPVAPSVGPGDRVLPGQVVGTVQDVPGHCAPGTCLHWGLRRGDAYLDPMVWVLGPGPVVLLPEH